MSEAELVVYAQLCDRERVLVEVERDRRSRKKPST
jgi:hypothetical protein